VSCRIYFFEYNGPVIKVVKRKREGGICIMNEVKAPMGGKVMDIKVNVGDSVNEGDEAVIIEAMKMELPVVCEVSGTVKTIQCKKGDTVEADAVLITIE